MTRGAMCAAYRGDHAQIPGKEKTMDIKAIEEMALALSWARTYLDDPGEAFTREETIDLIDSALRHWHNLVEDGENNAKD